MENNELVLENFISFCEEMEIVEEGFTSKNKANLMKSWAGVYRMDLNEAINKMNSFINLSKISANCIQTDLIQCAAITGVKKDAFSKIAQKIEDPLNRSQYCVQTLSTVNVPDTAATTDLNNMVNKPFITDDETKNAIVKSWLKKYRLRGYTVSKDLDGNFIVSKEVYGAENEDARKYWDVQKMVIVAEDGGGNSLVYSLKSGKFFDYDHEVNSGDDLDWLKNGIKYNDLMKFILETNKSLPLNDN